MNVHNVLQSGSRGPSESGCRFKAMVGTDDPRVAFKDADIALLVGARPRGPGMPQLVRVDFKGHLGGFADSLHVPRTSSCCSLSWAVRIV